VNPLAWPFAVTGRSLAACGSDAGRFLACCGSRLCQTMVVYYATGDTTRSRYIADAAVRDARQADSLLIRARAHAIQAEMAARNNQQWHAALARTTLGMISTPIHPAIQPRAHSRAGICRVSMASAGSSWAKQRQLGGSLPGPPMRSQHHAILSSARSFSQIALLQRCTPTRSEPPRQPPSSYILALTSSQPLAPAFQPNGFARPVWNSSLGEPNHSSPNSMTTSTAHSSASELARPIMRRHRVRKLETNGRRSALARRLMSQSLPEDNRRSDIAVS
jgi:hypothetical protein